jgi:hypothetical protein
VNPTYLDDNMAAAMLPESLELHVHLGHEFGSLIWIATLRPRVRRAKTKHDL